MSSRTYEVCFKEQRLGMMLQNAEHPELLGVEVRAFTEHQGKLGAAELSGQIQLGDIVTMVNNHSTAGLDFADVLDLVVGTERPITIHFERRSATVQPVQPYQQTPYQPPPQQPTHIQATPSGKRIALQTSSGSLISAGGAEAQFMVTSNLTKIIQKNELYDVYTMPAVPTSLRPPHNIMSISRVSQCRSSSREARTLFRG